MLATKQGEHPPACVNTWVWLAQQTCNLSALVYLVNGELTMYWWQLFDEYLHHSTFHKIILRNLDIYATVLELHDMRTISEYLTPEAYSSQWANISQVGMRLSFLNCTDSKVNIKNRQLVCNNTMTISYAKAHLILPLRYCFVEPLLTLLCQQSLQVAPIQLVKLLYSYDLNILHNLATRKRFPRHTLDWFL